MIVNNFGYKLCYLDMISNTDEKIIIRMNDIGYDEENSNFPIPPHIVEKSCACCWNRSPKTSRIYDMGIAIFELFKKPAVKTFAREPDKLAKYIGLTYSKVFPEETAKKYAKEWAMLIHMVELHGFESIFDENNNKVFPQRQYSCGGGESK